MPIAATVAMQVATIVCVIFIVVVNLRTARERDTAKATVRSLRGELASIERHLKSDTEPGIDGISDRFTQHPAIPRRGDENAWRHPLAPVRLDAHSSRFAGVGRTDLHPGAKQGGGYQSARGKRKMALPRPLLH